MRNIKANSIIKNLISVLSIILVAWLFISWMEIIMHNLTPGYDYWSGNIIIWYIKTFLC